MKKFFTLIAMCAAVTIGANAAPLSPEQALARVQADKALRSRSADASKQLMLAHTSRLDNGDAVAYVFTPAQGVGFTIASADDIAVPVLGYSDDSEFNADNIPAQLEWWLSEMGRRIEFLREHNMSFANGGIYAPEDMTPVAPLLTTIWNQDAPYNNDAPEVGGVQCPTGCVATSFAQAMNYFKYPARGNGTVSYQWNGKNLRLNLATKAIKWDLMLDDYVAGEYTDDQATAVSYLMKACGYSVNMNYTASSSGAQSYRLINALVNNFNYDSRVSYEDRGFYSPQQWTRMIYDNIKNVGPVIYDGAAIDGGHSFICDGYNGDGYFHFNWGWGGLSDGYYVLDVLNPEAQGTGGAVGGFNWGQNAVINMMKPEGEQVPQYTKIVQYGNTNATIDGNIINWGVSDYGQLGWGNGNFVSGNVKLGASVVNMATGEEVMIAEGGMNELGRTASLTVGYWYPYENGHPVISLPTGLADGTYKLTLVNRDASYEDAPWFPAFIQYGYCNYCLLKVENGVSSIINQSAKVLTFEELGFANDLYYGKNTLMKGKVVNDTDLDLTMCIQPVLVSDNKRQFEGDVMLVSANAGEEVEQEWIVTFHQLSTGDYFSPGNTYTLQLIDKTSDMVIGSFGEVVMERVNGTLKVVLNDFGIENAPQETVTVGSRDFRNTYIISGTSNDIIKLDYDVTGGYFDCFLSVGMQWFNPETNSYKKVEGYLYSTHPFLAEGQSANVEIPLDVEDLNKTGVYNVIASYILSGRNTRLGSFTFQIDQTGVDEIYDGAEAGEAVYYNMQGVRVESPAKGDILIRKIGSKVEKVTF